MIVIFDSFEIFCDFVFVDFNVEVDLEIGMDGDDGTSGSRSIDIKLNELLESVI